MDQVLGLSVEGLGLLASQEAGPKPETSEWRKIPVEGTGFTHPNTKQQQLEWKETG